MSTEPPSGGQDPQGRPQHAGSTPHEPNTSQPVPDRGAQRPMYGHYPPPRPRSRGLLWVLLIL